MPAETGVLIRSCAEHTSLTASLVPLAYAPLSLSQRGAALWTPPLS